MIKILKKAILFGTILFVLFWGASIFKCEILTNKYGKEFFTAHYENTMIGEIEYLKVLDYSDLHARIYYVSKNRTSGNILVFSKNGTEWNYKEWERTVWSKQGSADGFVWPYIR